MAIPMSNPNAELMLKVFLLTYGKRLRSRDDTANRKTAEEIFTQEIDEREQRTRVDMQEERRQRPHPASQFSEFLLYRRAW